MHIRHQGVVINRRLSGSLGGSPTPTACGALRSHPVEVHQMTELFIKTVGTDTVTLAADTAKIMDSSLANFKEATLLTKLKTEITGDWPNMTADRLLAVLAYGDATIAQIAEAFTGQGADFEDGTTWRIDQAKARVIVDFVALMPPRVNGDTQLQSILWDIPKGGFPSAKGNGWVLAVFNPVADLTNGPTLEFTSKYYFQVLRS